MSQLEGQVYTPFLIFSGQVFLHVQVLAHGPRGEANFLRAGSHNVPDAADYG